MKVIGINGVVYAQDEIDDNVVVRTTACYEEPLDAASQSIIVKELRSFMEAVK